MHAYMCDVREYGACLWMGVPETLVLIKVGEDEARELWRDLERLGFQLSSLTLISRQCKSRPLIGTMMLSICLPQSREQGSTPSTLPAYEEC